MSVYGRKGEWQVAGRSAALQPLLPHPNVAGRLVAKCNKALGQMLPLRCLNNANAMPIGRVNMSCASAKPSGAVLSQMWCKLNANEEMTIGKSDDLGQTSWTRS